jgi:hypothetical protein
MIKQGGNGEHAPATEQSGAGIGRNVVQAEQAHAEGVYTVTCTAPIEERREEYIALMERIAHLESKHFIAKLFAKSKILDLKAELADIPVYEKWTDTVHNLVTTVGKNDLLDKYLAGSSYTAAWYLGLISSVSYTAVNAADTMSSHAGWLEAGAANVPIYSQGARPTAAWASASSGSKALSSALAYTIATTGGTVKGCFLTSVATKDGTTGILYSAGLFTGGDKVVAVADTLNVSYTASV